MSLSKTHVKLRDEALQLLNQIVTEREAEFDERSEKWQEGDKGDEHQTKTDEVADIVAELENIE